MVTAINVFMRITITNMVKFLQFNTYSKETRFTIIAVYLANLLNIIVILVATDTAMFKDFFPKDFFKKELMDDYSNKWFEVDGELLVKMMLMAGIYPLIEATLIVPFYWSLRWADRNINRLIDGTATAMPSVDAYIELHGGPEFLLSYRLSAMLLQVSVALLYGVAVPVLYPIVFINLLIQNVIDRILLCYFYREPPHHDEKSTLFALQILKTIGVLSLFHHFWILSNRQIFEGFSENQKYLTDTKHSMHTIWGSIKDAKPHNYGTLILFAFLVLIWLFQHARERIKDDNDYVVISLSTNTPTYTQALNHHQRELLTQHEQYLSTCYDIQTMFPEFIDALKRENQRPDPRFEDVDILGVCSYRIADNPLYQLAF